MNIKNVKNIGFIKVYLFKDVQQNKILMVMREKNGVKYNPRVTKSQQKHGHIVKKKQILMKFDKL